MGSGQREKEVRGNRQLKQMLRILWAQDSVGNYWSLENPEDSFMFDVPEVRVLMSAAGVSVVRFDQCSYGLKAVGAPPGEMVKKPTVIVTNLPNAQTTSPKLPQRSQTLPRNRGGKD